MQKSIIIIVLFCASITIEAQVFNNVYDCNNSNDAGSEIIRTNDGNFLIVGNSSLENLLIKMNNQGDTLWSKKYNLSIGGDNARGVLELTNGGYLLCGTLYDSVTATANAYLMRINAQGDSLWMKKYGNTDAEWPMRVAQTPDGGFVAAGWKWLAPSFTYSDAWVFKTDSLGNLLWQKQFDEYGNSEFIEGLVVNADSTIVIGGETMINSSTSRAYLLKLASNGDTIWTKQFGGPEGAAIFKMDTTADKGYIVAGAKVVSGDSRAYAVKLDSLGNIIWEKDFARGNGASEYYSFAAIHEMPNGNFMAAGSDYDYTQVPPGDAPRARLFEINSVGDSIWSKQYTHYGGLNDDYIFDMKLTTDGGYIMCGYIINNSLPQLNDVLVIKVDSNGCDTSNCNVGINENTITANKVLVYPNPNNGVFTIQVANMKNPSIEIYSISGQLILQTKLKNNIRIIDINNQPNGLYLLKLSNGNQIITKRIVKK